MLSFVEFQCQYMACCFLDVVSLIGMFSSLFSENPDSCGFVPACPCSVEDTSVANIDSHLRDGWVPDQEGLVAVTDQDALPSLDLTCLKRYVIFISIYRDNPSYIYIHTIYLL